MELTDLKFYGIIDPVPKNYTKGKFS